MDNGGRQAGDLTFEVTEEMWEATRDALERELRGALDLSHGPDPTLVAGAVLEAALRASKSQGLSWRLGEKEL